MWKGSSTFKNTYAFENPDTGLPKLSVAQIKIQIQIWCANNQSHFSDFHSFTAK